MAVTKRSSPLRGSVLSSSSQLQSQSFQPATANSSFMPCRPNIGTCFAWGKTGPKRACCPTMTKQSDSPTSKWQDEKGLSGVVLSCFDRNDFILEALSNSQPDSSCYPTCFLQCFPLVLTSFKDKQCFAYIDTSAQPSARARLQKCIDFWRLLEISWFILNVIIQSYKIPFFIFPHLSPQLTMPLLITTVLLCLKLLTTYSSVVHDIITILNLITLLNCAIIPCMFCHFRPL